LNNKDNASYSFESLQFPRPQAMYDKKIMQMLSRIFTINPSLNDNLDSHFKSDFIEWLKGDKLNFVSGYDEFQFRDICVGCTHYIDDLYVTHGFEQIMVLENEYKYHWRLNNNLNFYKIGELASNKQLILSMPFPYYGDVHPNTSSILEECVQKNISVHIDAAWLSCCREIHFNFNHPAIKSFAISLSKGYGLGANRIALRFAREKLNGPISIMNEFNMNCQSLIHIGRTFINELGPNFFWNKYEKAYFQICKDFNLKPTKAIHMAISEKGPVGLRPLLRYLNDN
jgi:hypothetical protein